MTALTWTLVSQLRKKATSTWNQSYTSSTLQNPLQSSQCFAQFSIIYWNTVFECAFVHLMILFYRIWLKTVSIASPKEHENKRRETWRRRAEEIACVGQNNERNESKALDSKSPLYIFGKTALSQPGWKVCAGTFVNDSNFLSWQSWLL